MAEYCSSVRLYFYEPQASETTTDMGKYQSCCSMGNTIGAYTKYKKEYINAWQRVRMANGPVQTIELKASKTYAHVQHCS